MGTLVDLTALFYVDRMLPTQVHIQATRPHHLPTRSSIAEYYLHADI